ncbi:hypothetical protein N0V82_006629 [Gnomoniopsis sp. IMI 355080]|nr:hypothetical protein N0V82_006629 [Gnomoniopsis sp. IMI 355080]
MASSTGDAFAHFQSIPEIRDEIQVQNTILLSLEDGPQEHDTPFQIREARQTLRTLRQLLRTREAQAQAASKSLNPNSSMNPHDSYGASGRVHSNHSTPASANTSGTSSSIFAQRKRQFPPHLDDDDSTSSRNKSHRTTPSPSQTGVTTPSIDHFFDDSFTSDNALIDLTGDEDDVREVIKMQRDYFNRLEQQKEDEKLARTINDHGTPPNAQSPGPGNASRISGPTAFDRILGRPSQSSAAPAASASSQGNSYASSSNTARPNKYSVPGSFDVDGDLDYDDDSDSSQLLPVLDPAQLDEAAPINNPSGYYPSGNLAANSWNQNTQTPTFSSASQPQFGQPSFPHFPSQAPSVPAAELARRAAFSRQQNYGSFGGPSINAGMSGFGPTSALPGSAYNPLTPSAFNPFTPRPGVLSSGSYDPLHGFGGHHNGINLYNGLPLFSDGRGLSTIINQTNNIDWDRNLDAYGRPLNDRLRNYYEDLQDDPRKTEEEIKELLANIRPDEEIPEEDRVGTPEALRYPLYPHQQLALKWMTTSEEKKNKGGILADDMGLGKTISTLALLVSRQSSDRIKTNLIVGPVALVKQWEVEIAKKVKRPQRLSVFMLHGKAATYDDLRRYDVVLTTYGKLGFEEKRYAKWVEDHPGADPEADRELARSCPLLHPKSKFYRVILDEAQCIKNVNTFQARGACRLNATHRWCLTGTPMMNGIHELYSLIKFLRIAPYNSQKEFTRMFGCFSKSGKARSASEGTRTRSMNALRALLRAIMLRRMKTSLLDGKPLLDLPPKTEEVTHVVFDEDERAFYTNLETGARNTYNKYLRANTVGKNYSNVLVLLLRLRQACCHPHLNLDVEYVGNNEVTEESMKLLAQSLQPDVIARLKAANEEGFNCPICLDAVIDPTIVLPCGHNSCTECFSTLVAGAAESNLRDGNEGNSLKCPECRGPINPKEVINLTTFKAVHMPELNIGNENEAEEVSDSETASDDDSGDSDSESDDEEADDVDRNGNLRDFIVKDDEDEEDEELLANVRDEDDDLLIAEASTAESKKAKKAKKAKSKGKKKNKKDKGKAKKEEVKPHMLKTLRTEAKKNKAEYKRYMKYLKKNWLPSAKVTECCRLLSSIQESGDKTIVFSQFTFLLDLLEIPVKYELGLKYCRYDGGMSRTQRDAAALDFQDSSSETKVMLVSLKAGNAGLNLTSANHVIILDPFWNPYIEMQAVDRAHRIGQQKPVQVHRLLVEETVEDRITALQEQKRQFVDAALDEGESKQLGRLSIQDLTYLFNGSRA